MARVRFCGGFRLLGDSAIAGINGSNAVVRFERVGIRDGFMLLAPSEARALAAALTAAADEAEATS